MRKANNTCLKHFLTPVISQKYKILLPIQPQFKHSPAGIPAHSINSSTAASAAGSEKHADQHDVL